jgi:response regulator of citrate/malate metabolism
VIFLTVSKEDDIIKEFLNLGAFGYLTKPFRPSEIIFILTKAFKYKILKEHINKLENMEHDFNSLHDTITKLANQGIDAELGRRILIDRQNSFQLSQFFNLYNDRKHTISEKIDIIEKLSHQLCSDNVEYSQALKDFKNAVQDLNRGFSIAEEGLKEIEERKNKR